MATNSSATPHKDPLEEASDPATDTERLRYLANHKREDVRLAAIQNPGVPEDVWRKALLEGLPEALSNPMAPIYLLVWSPKPGDQSTLESAIRRATQALWKNPERCSPDGKVLLNVQIMNLWAASVSAWCMIAIVQSWASAKGNGSDEHKAMVRLLMLCAQTVPNLPAEDRQALDLLEAWCAGRKDRREEAYSLASSKIVEAVILSATNPSGWHNPWEAIYEILKAVSLGKPSNTRSNVSAEHDRLLADLIRREMPLPPQFE